MSLLGARAQLGMRPGWGPQEPKGHPNARRVWPNDALRLCPSEFPRFRVFFPPNMTDPDPATAGTRVYGEGLSRLLDLVAERMPRAEVEAVWAFPGVRREGREHGFAVIERRVEGERRLVYRGRYVVHLKGQERGKVAVELEETAEALPATLQRVLEGVRQRADEAGEAEPVDLAAWKQDAEPVGG